MKLFTRDDEEILFWTVYTFGSYVDVDNGQALIRYTQSTLNHQQYSYPLALVSGKYTL